MKNFAKMMLVALMAGGITLGTYKYLEQENLIDTQTSSTHQPISTTPMRLTPASYKGASISSSNADFTEAADRTVHAVVHVQNVQEAVIPQNRWDYIHGRGELQKAPVGSGSGVIISQDGYIVTNNHVIDGASELDVMLNNDKKYTAKVIGTDPENDIALLKINADEDLPYLPFGDSDAARLGEWVLAVGNPYNLTSTVTAGIISAKGRDIGPNDSSGQAYIQTDAAINPGNSGGALVNINGELIGINSALFSQTGSYVGYSFAIPSNLARKIVEDIMEYGDVQRGILGVQGMNITAKNKDGLKTSENNGFYVGAVEPGSGAEKAGIKKGDVIKEVDGKSIHTFDDLSTYLNTKRPDDVVNLKVFHEGNIKDTPVKLYKLETYTIQKIGLAVKNISQKELKNYKVSNGVVINSVLSEKLKRYDLTGIVISKINDHEIQNIDDVKRQLEDVDDNDPMSVTLVSPGGEQRQVIMN